MLILLFILIFSMGLYTFNTATSTVTQNMERLESAEIQDFNDSITQYEGRRMGSLVKALISTLVSNAGMNQDNDDRLPDIVYNEGEGPVLDEYLCNIYSDSFDTNVEAMMELRSKIENSHYYEIEVSYNNETGLVEEIIINY